MVHGIKLRGRKSMQAAGIWSIWKMATYIMFRTRSVSLQVRLKDFFHGRLLGLEELLPLVLDPSVPQ